MAADPWRRAAAEVRVGDGLAALRTLSHCPIGTPDDRALQSVLRARAYLALGAPSRAHQALAAPAPRPLAGVHAMLRLRALVSMAGAPGQISAAATAALAMPNLPASFQAEAQYRWAAAQRLMLDGPGPTLHRATLEALADDDAHPTMAPRALAQLSRMDGPNAGWDRRLLVRWGHTAEGCATQDRACAITLVQSLGARLFRRPLTGEEAGRYLAIYDLAAPDGFEPAVRWVLAGLLQSPHFLYRTELGRRTDTGFVLTPYEIATELSYLFWQTSPDDDLWALAESGALLGPAVQAAQAQRLLADPRSAETMARFTERWLDLTRLASVSRDAELYGALTPALRADMAEQTRRLVTEAWTSGASLADLLSADQVWVNGALAAHYGLPAPAGGAWAQVSAAGSPYGGVLAEGSVLTAHAKPISSSPIHRGKLVRERLLCQDLPPPPAGLDTSPPDVDPARSTRDRYAEHAGNPACSSCHRLMDPIGFGFEHFDGIGRYRELDGAHPVDARGFLLDAGPGITNFEGLAGLQAALAGNVMVDNCYTVQWIRFGLGTDEADHALDVGCYAERLTPGISTLRGVLPALVGTPHFTRRVGTAEEADVPGADLVPTEPGAVVEPPPDPVEPDPVEPDPVGPGETAGAMLSLVEASRWGTGYCSNATVLNTTDAPLVWAVAAQVEGHINNLWNAEGSADSGRVVFHGVAWNAELAPGQVAAFGFCADL